MRKTLVGLLVGAVVAFAGCESKSTPGGQGAVTNASHKAPMVGESDNSFSLTVPTLSTSIKQGETKAVTVGIKRGKNFDEDVALKFTGMPQGVTIDPASPMIKHGDKEANLTIKAAADAAVGKFTIQVTGHPTKGPDASNEFNVTVDKK